MHKIFTTYKEAWEKEFKCLGCGFICDKESELRKHNSWNHRIECRNCEHTFKTNIELEVHRAKEHVTSLECLEGKVHMEKEFNCIECPFQGSEELDLSKHIQIKHRMQCRSCGNFFKTKPDLMMHRKKEHYNIVAPCKQGSECKFLERCWWKHGTNNESQMIECYFCDEEFPTKGEVMIHRKNKHSKTVKTCTKFNSQTCNKTDATCWFKHIEEDRQVFQDHRTKNQNP